MCRCMDWTGASILMNRWSCKPVARTARDGQLPGGSRKLRCDYFSMTWMNRAMVMTVHRDDSLIRSRKPRLKYVISGLGEVVGG